MKGLQYRHTPSKSSSLAFPPQALGSYAPSLQFRKQLPRAQSQKEYLLPFILLTFLVVLCCFVCFQLLVIQCRAWLADSARVELSPNTVADFSLIENEASPNDFYRLVGLARLCPESKGAVSLRLVEIYYRLLTWDPLISLASDPRSAEHIHNETRACTHFAAVLLETRIARARQVVRESCPPR